MWKSFPSKPDFFLRPSLSNFIKCFFDWNDLLCFECTKTCLKAIYFLLSLFIREGGSGSGITKQSNVNGTATKKSSDIIPNLYKTAAEHFSNSDFYSTYNVDRQKFAQITQNSKRKNIYDSTDNLSASLDDLLESYRQSEKQPKNSNSAIMEGTNGRLSNSSTVIANGRASPGPEVDGLR